MLSGYSREELAAGLDAVAMELLAAAKVDRAMIEDCDDYRRRAVQHSPGDQFVAGRRVYAL